MLRIPHSIVWDDRLPPEDGKHVEDINRALSRLNELRALEIVVSGPFAQSKIAWKLAVYQHVLLHRIVALVDGVAVAWNNRSTLAAMLSARAFMETIALFYEFQRQATKHLGQEDLSELNKLSHGLYATRDEIWLAEHPEDKATNILTYINSFAKLADGFRGHYDMLSERCHANAQGHNFMFSRLDRTDGTVTFFDESDPKGNAHLILTALIVLPLVEDIMAHLDGLMLKVAALQHRVSPRGGSRPKD